MARYQFVFIVSHLVFFPLDSIQKHGWGVFSACQIHADQSMVFHQTKKRVQLMRIRWTIRYNECEMYFIKVRCYVIAKTRVSRAMKKHNKIIDRPIPKNREKKTPLCNTIETNQFVESYMTINWKDILTNMLPQRSARTLARTHTMLNAIVNCEWSNMKQLFCVARKNYKAYDYFADIRIKIVVKMVCILFWVFFGSAGKDRPHNR